MANLSSVLNIEVEHFVMCYCPVTDGDTHLEDMGWRPCALTCQLFDLGGFKNHLFFIIKMIIKPNAQRCYEVILMKLFQNGK